MGGDNGNGAAWRQGVDPVDTVLDRIVDGELRALAEDEADAERAGPFDFAELVEFYREAGFLYDAKLRALEPHLPEIRRTWEALAASGGRLGKLVERRRPLGRQARLSSSLGAFLYAPRTWLAQHLVSVRRGSYMDTLVALLGLATWFEDNPSIENVRLTFRPDNPGVARLFGAWAAAFDERACAISLHDHAICPVEREARLPRSLERRLTVREATPADLGSIREILAAAAGPVEVDSLGLEDLGLDSVNAAYTELGLTRRRRVLLAERRHEVVGLVVLHSASEGMNFSFLENAAEYLEVRGEPDDSFALAVAVALLRAAFAHARSEGRAELVISVAPRWRPLIEDLVPEPAGIRRYGVLTYARSHDSYRRLRRATIAYYRESFLRAPRDGRREGRIDVLHHAGAA